MLKLRFDRERGLPLALTGLVIILDQITKSIIAGGLFFQERWPINSMIADVFDNDVLHIIHVRNTAIAFSIGQNLPEPAKRILFVILPVIVLLILVWYYLSSDEFTRLQRWATAGIFGGGLGNIGDRIFRPDGVVDFISVKFYGIFGFERWPTFNVADASVVVSCVLLLVTIFAAGKKAAGEAGLPPELPAAAVLPAGSSGEMERLADQAASQAALQGREAEQAGGAGPPAGHGDGGGCE